jgi:L-serine dehydratase
LGIFDIIGPVMPGAVAIVSAILAGLESVFAADAVIETMGKVGRRLPEEFRETARGGLASIPLPG